MRTVVRGIVRFGDRYLLMRRGSGLTHSPGKWEFPAGKANDGESDEQAFFREMLEETGRVFRPRSSFEMQAEGSTEVYRLVCFICDADSEMIKMSNEHTDFKWLEMKDIVGMDLSKSTLDTLKKMGVM
jgi:8-oxo-dGTP diphosphatase